MSDQRTRDAEEAARKLGACLDDVHANCIRIAPGEERVNGVVVVCTVPWAMSMYTCGHRPVYRCTDCGAFVCELHAGKPCPATDKNGKRCVLRLNGSSHYHEYAR